MSGLRGGCSGVCASFAACCGCVGVRSACSSCHGHILFTSGRMAVIKVSRTHENGSPRGPAEQEQHTQGQAPDVVGRATGTQAIHALPASFPRPLDVIAMSASGQSLSLHEHRSTSVGLLRVLPLACVL